MSILDGINFKDEPAERLRAVKPQVEQLKVLFEELKAENAVTPEIEQRFNAVIGNAEQQMQGSISAMLNQSGQVPQEIFKKEPGLTEILNQEIPTEPVPLPPESERIAQYELDQMMKAQEPGILSKVFQDYPEISYGGYSKFAPGRGLQPTGETVVPVPGETTLEDVLNMPLAPLTKLYEKPAGLTYEGYSKFKPGKGIKMTGRPADIQKAPKDKIINFVNGAGEGLAELVEGLTTPTNIALMVGTQRLGGALGAVSSAYFTADLGVGAAKSSMDFLDALENEDWEKAGKSLAHVLGSVKFAYGSAKHFKQKWPKMLIEGNKSARPVINYIKNQPAPERKRIIDALREEFKNNIPPEQSQIFDEIKKEQAQKKTKKPQPEPKIEPEQKAPKEKDAGQEQGKKINGEGANIPRTEGKKVEPTVEKGKVEKVPEKPSEEVKPIESKKRLTEPERELETVVKKHPELTSKAKARKPIHKMTEQELIEERKNSGKKTYDEIQAELDKKLDYLLEEKGISFKDANNNPEVLDLYRKRDVVGQLELLNAHKEMKKSLTKGIEFKIKTKDPNIIKLNDLKVDPDKILDEIYKVNPQTAGGQYIASEYTKELVKNKSKTRSDIYNKLIELYGEQYNLNMENVMNEFVSGWGNDRIDAFKNAVTTKAAKIARSLETLFGEEVKEAKKAPKLKPPEKKKLKKTVSQTVREEVRKRGGLKPTKDYEDLPKNLIKKRGTAFDELAKTLQEEGVIPKDSQRSPSEVLYDALKSNKKTISAQEKTNNKDFFPKIPKEKVQVGTLEEGSRVLIDGKIYEVKKTESGIDFVGEKLTKQYGEKDVVDIDMASPEKVGIWKPGETVPDVYQPKKKKMPSEEKPIEEDEIPFSKRETKASRGTLFSKKPINVFTAPKEKKRTAKKTPRQKAKITEEKLAKEKGIDLSKVKPIESPELLEIYKAYHGKKEAPAIDKEMGLSGAEGALKTASGKILISTDVPIGKVIQKVIYNERFVIPEKDLRIKAEILGIPWKKFYHKWDTVKNREVLTFYELDPTLLGKVFAHELGHLDQYYTTGIRKKSLPGIIAGLKEYTKNFLPEHPDIKARPISPKERARLKREAKASLTKNYEKWVDQYIEKNTSVTPQQILDIWNAIDARNMDPALYDFVAKLSTAEKKKLVADALRGKVPEWVPGQKRKVKVGRKRIKVKEVPTPKEIAKKYESFLFEEIRKRGLIYKEMFAEELYELSKKWRPFDENFTDYKEYRQDPRELFADAISVLYNDPGMLKTEAPLFSKAFANYAGNRKIFREKFLELQRRLDIGESEILAKRREKIHEMFEREKEIQLTKEPETKNTLWQELKKQVYDVREPAKEPIRKKIIELKERAKVGNPIAEAEFKKIKDVKYDIDNLSHANSAIKLMLRDVQHSFRDAVKKMGITRKELGEMYLLRRIKGERKYLANPGAFNAEHAVKQLGFLKEQLGTEKFNALVEFKEKHWEQRKEHVFPLLEQSKMFSDQLMDKIKNEYDYGKFNVLDFMEKSFGSEVAGRIFRQKGTMKDVGNPFLNTVINDAAMMRAAHRNKIVLDYVTFMRKNFGQNHPDSPLIYEAKYGYIKGKGGKGYRYPLPAEKANIPDVNPRELGTVYYLYKGKLMANYFPKDIARSLNGNWIEAGQIYGMVQTANNIPRQIFVAKNIPWAINNIRRDMKTAAKQIPGLTLVGRPNWEAIFKRNPEIKQTLWIPGIISRVVRNLGKTYREAFKGESDPLIREMYKTGALPVFRKYQSKYSRSEVVEFDKMMQQYSLHPEKHKNLLIKTGKTLLKGLEDFGRMSEISSKIASYEHLKEFFPNMTARERAWIVQNLGGSPDFLVRGMGYRFYNNLWLFSNAGKQGIVSNVDAFNLSPAEFSWKVLKYDVLPKAAMYLASAGAITAYGKAINNKRLEEEGEWLQRMFTKIPEHDKTNYQCVPIGETHTGKCVYMVMPHDFEGQVIAGAFWKTLNIQKPKDIQELLKVINQGQPFSQISPSIKIGMYTANYVMGKNSMDDWKDRPLVNPNEWAAGGTTRAKTFVKSLYNKFGPSWIYRFPYDDIDRVSSQLEKTLRIPGFQGVFRKFIRISDRGESESYYSQAEELEPQKAREKLQLREFISKKVNEKDSHTYKDMSLAWREAKEAGIPLKRWQDFKNTYLYTLAKKKNDQLYLALRYKPKDERAVILSKKLGKKITPDETSRYIRDMERKLLGR